MKKGMAVRPMQVMIMPGQVIGKAVDIKIFTGIAYTAIIIYWYFIPFHDATKVPIARQVGIVIDSDSMVLFTDRAAG